MTATRSTAPPGLLPLEEQQWSLTALQMVNWGCYGGHVKVEFPRQQTLITGASGAGKSTLLDAHTALIYRTGARFNRASNPTDRGRARGDTERNVVKYIRGRYVGTRDSDGRPVERELRDGTVWAALAETYRREGDGATVTFWIAFYLRPDDDRPLTRWAHTPGTFNLLDLEPFVGPAHTARPLPPARIKEAHPGTEFCDGPTDFRHQVYAHVGLTERAARLLEDIQGSAGVPSVTLLFTTLVLDRPGTYDAADNALAHFTKCADAYRDLRDVEDQIELLAPIQVWRAELTKVREAVDFYGPIGVSQAPQDSAYWLWLRDLEYRLVGDAITVNRAAHAAAAQRVAEASDHTRLISGRLKACRDRLAAAGGHKLALVDEQIRSAEEALRRATATRSRYQESVEPYFTCADSPAEHDQQRAASRAWLAGYDQQARQLQEERDDLEFRRRTGREAAAELRREGQHLLDRKDLTPRDRDQDRRDFAAAAGITPEALPFLAELIDVLPEWEEWRMPIEKALGGLAGRLLVPEAHLATYRARVDPLRTARRYQYIPVLSYDVAFAMLDPDTAAGRLQFKDRHPYSPWLSHFLADRLDHRCVADGDALNDLAAGVRGLTAHGQVREAHGGAHGGQQNHRPVIGFSPAARLDQIAREVTRLHTVENGLTDRRIAVEAHLDALAKERLAHQAADATPWDDIDVHTPEVEVGRLRDEKERLRASDADLAAAEDELDALEDAHKTAITAEGQARTAVGQVETEHEDLVDRQDEASRHQDRMLEADVAFSDHDRLTTKLAEWLEHQPTLGDLTTDTWRRFATHLHGETGRNKQIAAERAQSLTDRFVRFNQRWSSPNRGTDPDTSYEGFEQILINLNAAGMDALRSSFVEWTSRVTGLELVRMKEQFDAAPQAIRIRLHQINTVLARLPFSSHGGRVLIEPIGHHVAELQQFRADLVDLAEEATTDLDFDTAVDRFRRLDALMSQIDPNKTADKASRDRILDVRQHLTIEAHHYLPGDTTPHAVYNSLADTSGGEMQELAMFILGAALRYQLGDVDSDKPRYAPVFFDEGMIKADPEHTDRALQVWTELGFQPIVAVPVDKFESAQQGVPSYTLQISRDSRRLSRIDPIQPLP